LSRFRLHLCFFLLFITLLPLLAQEEVFCPQIANYDMDVRLHPERKIIEGQEILTWTNPTNQATAELWFHLYWNAFQNNRSTYLWEEWWEGGNPTADFQEEDWGYCQIDSITLISRLKYPALFREQEHGKIIFSSPNGSPRLESWRRTVGIAINITPIANITLTTGLTK